MKKLVLVLACFCSFLAVSAVTLEEPTEEQRSKGIIGILVPTQEIIDSCPDDGVFGYESNINSANSLAQQSALKSILDPEDFNLYIYDESLITSSGFDFAEKFTNPKGYVDIKCADDFDAFGNAKRIVRVNMVNNDDVISITKIKGGSGNSNSVSSKPIKVAGVKFAPAKPNDSQSDPVIFSLSEDGAGFNISSTLQPSSDKKIFRATLKKSFSVDILNNGSQDFTFIIKRLGKNKSEIEVPIKVGETGTLEFRKGKVQLDIQRVDAESGVAVDLDISIAKSSSGNQKLDFNDIIGSSEFNLTGTFDSFLSPEKIAIPVLLTPLTLNLETITGDFSINVYQGKKANPNKEIIPETKENGSSSYTFTQKGRHTILVTPESSAGAYDVKITVEE